MHMQLRKIKVMSSAYLFCFLHFGVGVVAGGLVSVGSFIDPEAQSPYGLGVWSVLVFPVLNGVIGFVLGALLACAYNVYAARSGGIVAEWEEV